MRPAASTREGLATRRSTSSQKTGEKEARRIVGSRSNGMCEGCGQAPASDWSHRVAKGQGGPWSAVNGLHLCRKCHRWGHLNPTAARDERGWLLRSTDDPTTFPALVAGWGWVRLTEDGMYMPTEAPEPRSVSGVHNPV